MGILTNERNPNRPLKLFEFTEGIDLDRRFFREEIAVQKVWARGLNRRGYLQDAELQAIVDCLTEAETQIAEGKFLWKIEDEDIHMNLERFAIERLGDLGKRIHYGRSRNDLIATSLRLFVANQSKKFSTAVGHLTRALATHAQAHVKVLIPGTTHLQSGQPIRYAHALLAHAWSFRRDQERFTEQASDTLRECPLGSGAMAGTHLDLDLEAIAVELGFVAAGKNAYDLVGNRDFMLDFLGVMSTTALHLSRFAEDVIYWASPPVGLVQLPKEWSTGSSIMPNKRNPDVAELVRAKCAQVMGAHTTALTLMKALPTSYNSDLHELKRVVIAAIDQMDAMLEILPHFVAGLGVNHEQALRLLNHGHILATYIANHLVSQKLSFRTAYTEVAALVQQAEARGCQVHQLDFSLVEGNLSGLIDRDFWMSLSYESAVESCDNAGGTSLKQIQTQLRSLLER